MVAAKVIQIATEPGIDDVFAGRDDDVENGAILQSIHGKRPVKSLRIADQGKLAAGLFNIGQLGGPKFAQIAQAEKTLVGVGCFEGLVEVDMKADESGDGHNRGGSGAEERCGSIDGEKTNEHGEQRNSGDEESAHEVGESQPEENDQQRGDGGEEDIGAMSIE